MQRNTTTLLSYCDRYLEESPLVQFQTNQTFSPASFLSSRLGADIESGSIFVASGTKVYRLHTNEIASKALLSKDTTDARKEWKKRYKQVDSSSKDDLILSHLGTTNNWLPLNVVGDVSLDTIKHISHRWEIQSLQVRRLSNKELQIATVDGWGRAVLSCCCRWSHEEKSDCCVRNTYAIAPISMEDGEEGWTGLDWDPWHVSRVAIARQFFRDLTIYDKDLASRQLALTYTPHAVRFLSHVSEDHSDGEDGMRGIGERDNTHSAITSNNFHLIACLQGSYLSIWDTRVGEGGGRIHHKCYGSGSLYGMDIDHCGSIAVGGVDRMISILDPRTWSVRCRWNNCLKYECKHVLFPSKENWRCIAVGVDNELSCGYVGTALPVKVFEKRPRMMSGASLVSCKRLFGFRADSRWIGVTKQFVNGYNYILGMSENGSLYWTRMKTFPQE